MLIADGPRCVVRWNFIYFTTHWIDSEHLQSAGPAPAKLMCVYTLGRLRETHNWRDEAEGPGANHKHFSCLANCPKEERFKNRDKSITYVYDLHHPDAVSLPEAFLNLSLQRGSSTDWGCVAAAAQHPSSLPSPVVIYFLIDWDCRPFQTLTTGDQLEWERGVLLWGYWLLSKFT